MSGTNDAPSRPGDQVGTVTELWRFPVKSMQGERVPVATLTENGIEGDRRWGIVDPATGKVLSAKTVPLLLEATARAGDDVVEIALPDGTRLSSTDGASCDAALSGWLGRPVALRRAEKSAGTTYQMTFDPPDDEAELFDIPTPDGTYFDLAPIHVLTTGSLAAASAEHPDGAWDPRRFRPNLLIETGAGAAAFPEDIWVDHIITAGTARLTILQQTVRCAIPLRAQPAHGTAPALDRDTGIYRTLTAVHNNHLGAYAGVAEPGRIALGDLVRVEARGTGGSDQTGVDGA